MKPITSPEGSTGASAIHGRNATSRGWPLTGTVGVQRVVLLDRLVKRGNVESQRGNLFKDPCGLDTESVLCRCPARR